MGTLFINGKFTAQRTTGVQRVAAQVVQALDTLLAGPAGTGLPRPVLLLPESGRPLPLRHLEQRVLPGARASLHLWEQALLPRAVGRHLLLNLSGSAPAWARRQMAVLHDAAVFDAPQAYTTAFVAWYRWLFRRLARRALNLFTVSAFSRDRLAACLGVPPQRFDLLPLGADHLAAVTPSASVLQRQGLEPQRYLLAVGSRNPNKNLAALVQAFQRLPAGHGLVLALAGGSDARVFAGAGRGGGGEHGPGQGGGRILDLGPVDDAELKALYSQALALVFPSRYEGFGLPPLEAMACGCPVAVSRAASLPEACGSAALYFDPQDGDDILRCLQRLQADASLRRQLRDAGQAHAAAFRWQHPAQVLLQAWRQHA